MKWAWSHNSLRFVHNICVATMIPIARYTKLKFRRCSFVSSQFHNDISRLNFSASFLCDFFLRWKKISWKSFSFVFRFKSDATVKMTNTRCETWTPLFLAEISLRLFSCAVDASNRPSVIFRCLLKTDTCSSSSMYDLTNVFAHASDF